MLSLSLDQSIKDTLLYKEKMSPNLIGYVAAALTTLSFFPQAIKTLRSRDTRGISLRMYLLFTIGVALWAIYSLQVNDGPVFICNIITLIPASVVLLMKTSSLININT